MKIFSKEQIYQADKLTIERQEISSTELMERAATQVFNWIHLRLQGAQVPIHVFCGIGNNGGDGLVIARHLITHGYNVKTYVINCSEKRSKDFLVNYDRIKNVTKDWPSLLSCTEDFPLIEPQDVIVDAIFGIGLNRPVDDWVKKLFMHFRASKAFTISVDVPSGLFIDKPLLDEDAVVWASVTLSFASVKLVFFLPETAKFSPQWDVLDIGLDQEFLMTTETNAKLIGKPDVRSKYQPRDKFDHKGKFGHTLIIGGSYGKIGAVTLASKAVLAAGAGLVSCFVPKCGYMSLQTAFPEGMVITDKNEEKLTSIKYSCEPNVIGFGIGAGTANETLKSFELFLKQNKKPLVVDADGINMLAQDRNLLKWIAKVPSVLTPHPKELERLIGTWTDDFDKLEKTRAFSKKYDSIIIIKGAHSITVYHDNIYINTTGNPGLATAGSGDVLMGIITGLIAQGYDLLTASIFGVYLHGKSADIAIQDYGYEGLLASYVIDYLGQAFLDLFKTEEPQETSAENKEEPKVKEKGRS